MLGCLLFKGEDLIIFSEPKKTWFAKPHITSSSEVVIIKRPKPLDPDLVQYPIPLHLQETEIEKFGHIAECIQRKVVVWGGYPDDATKVHIFDTDEKTWTNVPAS